MREAPPSCRVMSTEMGRLNYTCPVTAQCTVHSALYSALALDQLPEMRHGSADVYLRSCCAMLSPLSCTACRVLSHVMLRALPCDVACFPPPQLYPILSSFCATHIALSLSVPLLLSGTIMLNPCHTLPGTVPPAPAPRTATRATSQPTRGATPGGGKTFSRSRREASLERATPPASCLNTGLGIHMPMGWPCSYYCCRHSLFVRLNLGACLHIGLADLC